MLSLDFFFVGSLTQPVFDLFDSVFSGCTVHHHAEVQRVYVFSEDEDNSGAFIILTGT